MEEADKKKQLVSLHVLDPVSECSEHHKGECSEWLDENKLVSRKHSSPD